MSNQDKLHTWWWSDGPSISDPLTIGEIEMGLQPAKAERVASGRQGKTISNSGWNYAVLKFLIEKCTLSEGINSDLVANADPQKGNYASWRKYRNVQATVNSDRVHAGTVVLARPDTLRVSDNEKLKDLIIRLQKSIAGDGMNKETVVTAIRVLSSLGYQYDYMRFPEFTGTANFDDTSRKSPSNLAEALLWKLGKWNSYKTFASNYADSDASPTQQNVVFFAFARHLKDRENPIYDQHALRALWAICGNLTTEERKQCKSLLFDKKSKWKQVGSGTNTIKCYELFVKHINGLTISQGSATKAEVDKLLMPLGQAIKKSTSSFSEFHHLCDWSTDDK